MPELPEVEVTRRSFSERIRGARVTRVRLGKPLRWPLGCAPASLVAQTVGEVARRGKYLWLALNDGGSERGGLLLHLGMSGSLAFSESPGAGAPGPGSARAGGAGCERLAAGVREPVARALGLGGSTLRDFRDTHGMAGEFQLRAQVYGRAGEPCRVCGTPIRRLVQGQRATFFCPGCQRR